MMAVFLLIMLLLNAIDKFLFRARNGTFLNIILSLLSVSLLFIPLPVGGGLPTENIFDLTVVIGYLVLRQNMNPETDIKLSKISPNKTLVMMLNIIEEFREGV